jgi:hypothetical protein
LKNIFFFLSAALLFSFEICQAEEDSAALEKARTRQYVGGADESDLKVQTQLMKIQKSKNETTIEDAEEGF